jgi:hypothetical protein
MTATCHPLPPFVAHEMLQTAARAMCDRPGENAAQRESRTNHMVQMALAMEPRDGLEHMLSILAVGHFNLILDSMRDVFQGQQDAMNARAKSIIVALDRSLLGFVRELRVSRKRPSAGPAVEGLVAAPVTAQPPITNPGSSPAPPGLPTGLTGKGAAAFIAPVRTAPLAAPASAKPPPLPPVAPSRPPTNILRHPQTGPADQFLAEFEEALAVEAARKKSDAAHAREKDPV